jgi:hypothetical protein
MRHITRLPVFLALVVFSFPTVAQQPSGQVSLPDIDEVPAPASASLSSIEDQGGPLPGGEAFSLYRWDRFPAVLIFDLADFPAQNRMFSRLAFYLEKSGYRGRLLSDSQLAGRHGWNAHDYGPAGLASFFNAAETARFPLDAEELLLRAIALREGIIVAGDTAQGGGTFVPGAGAVLSISRSSSKYERILLLAHESYHGIYFCSKEYQELCARIWKSAPAAERLFMTRLLGALGYDATSRDLVVNEFQAYLLQQPRSMAAAYFERVGKLLTDAAGNPAASDAMPGLMKDESTLEAFLRSRYGIRAGGAYAKAGAEE